MLGAAGERPNTTQLWSAPFSNSAALKHALLWGPVCGIAAVAVVQYPSLARAVVAGFAFICLFLIASAAPARGIQALVIALPFLSLVRHLLLLVAPSPSYDPLLLVAPLLSCALLAQFYVINRHALPTDTLSKMIYLLLAVSLVEAVNPANGGLLAGFSGLLFVSAPLIWYIVGRRICSLSVIKTILLSSLIVSCIAAVYGLNQSWNGLPSWDAAWAASVSSSTYQSLSVNGVIRAFGTFASSAEYATFLAMALVIALALAWSGRRRALLCAPLVGLAIILGSDRGIIVFLLLAAAGMYLARSQLTERRLLLFGIVLLALVAFMRFAGSALSQRADASGNPLVSHLVGGLLNPFDPQHSTLLLHAQIVGEGLRSAVSHPLGRGTAATNIAGAKAGADVVSTEVDISNAFVGFGLVGGTLYLLVIVRVLTEAVQVYRRTRSWAVHAALGLELLLLSQWLNGGYYAVAPLLWLVIGGVAQHHTRFKDTVIGTI